MLSLFFLVECVFQLVLVHGEDSHVLHLNKETFDQAINAHEFILVKFYAPWCGHCKALEPEYIKAAALLHQEDSAIKLAKVDATEEKDLATHFEVRGYPTLKFFINGSPVEYSGNRDAQSIVNWCKKKTGPAAVSLDSLDDLRKFIEKENFAVVGFVKDPNSPLVQSFNKVANEMDSIVFAVASHPSILDEYQVSKDIQVSIFKKFDEPRVDFTDDNLDDLNNFIRKEVVPLVTEFSQETASVVFSSPIKRHIVAFLSSSHSHIRPHLEQSAKDLKGITHVIAIDVDVEDHGRILEFFNIKKEEVPTYRLIDLHQDMVKYKPDSSEMTSEAITSFANKCAKDQWEPYFASEEIPEADSKAVRVLVGKNYMSVVNDKSKHVFVKLYAPWCGHCQKLAPEWEKLGEAFQDRDDVVIAKMDVTANEVPGLRVESYPTIKLYPKDSDEVIDYNGERTLDSLKKFLESDGKTVPPRGKATDEEEDEQDQRDEL